MKMRLEGGYSRNLETPGADEESRRRTERLGDDIADMQRMLEGLSDSSEASGDVEQAVLDEIEDIKRRLDGLLGSSERGDEALEVDEDFEPQPDFLKGVVEDQRDVGDSGSREPDMDLGRYPEGSEMIYDDSENGESGEEKTLEEQLGESVLGVAANMAESEPTPDLEARLLPALQYCKENDALPDGLSREDRIAVAKAYLADDITMDLPGGLSVDEEEELTKWQFDEMLKEIES